MPRRMNDSTITTRVKHVRLASIAGSKTRLLIKSAICTGGARFSQRFDCISDWVACSKAFMIGSWMEGELRQEQT